MKFNAFPIREAMNHSLSHFNASEERRAAIRRYIAQKETPAQRSSFNPRLALTAGVLIVLFAFLAVVMIHPRTDYQAGNAHVTALPALQPLTSLPTQAVTSPASTPQPFTADDWELKQDIKADCALWFRDNLSGYIVTPLDERYADGSSPDYTSYYLRPHSTHPTAVYDYFAYYNPDGTIRQLSREIRADAPEQVPYLSRDDAFLDLMGDSALPIDAKIYLDDNDPNLLYATLMKGSVICFIWDADVGQFMDIQFQVRLNTPEPLNDATAAPPDDYVPYNAAVVQPDDSAIPLEQIYHDLAYWFNVNLEGVEVGQVISSSDENIAQLLCYSLRGNSTGRYEVWYTKEGLLQNILLLSNQQEATTPHPYTYDVFVNYLDDLPVDLYGVLSSLFDNPSDLRSLLARTYEDLPGVPKGTLVTFAWNPLLNTVVQIYFSTETADPDWLK